MEKLDLVKRYKSYYTATAKPQLITLEPVRYLGIEGKGDPSAPAFTASIEALYPVAYSLKFNCKARGNDFAVPKLEGLWWFDATKYGHVAMQDAPRAIPRSEWCYRLLIRLPDFVAEADVALAIDQVVAKKNLALAKQVALYELHEGTCIQVMHTGQFDREPETLEKIRAFSVEHGLRQNGLHHEIYLSDFRKTAPEKLKTILREPVC